MCKFIFSVLLVLLSFTGKGQTVDGKLYTIFNNWYQWSGGKFNTNLNIPKVTATTGRDTGGIRYSLADSSMYIWTGSQWRAVGSSLDTSSLSNRINLKQNLITLTTTGTSGNATFNQSSGALNIPNYSTDTSSLSNRINQRVKYTDTAAMLSPYLRSANVVTPTLQQVTTAGNTTTDSLNVIDGTKRLATLTKEFTGSSYYSGTLLLNSNSDNDYLKINHNRIVKFNTDLHTIWLPDSTGVLTQRVKVNGTTYNTDDNGVIDLGTISGDTTSLSNRINERVKYTDTAAMLSPYLRSSVAAATYQPIGNTDTATVVKAYVTNAEAVTITKGQVVYIFGASGDRASVKLAKNTSDTFSSKTLGIVRANIAAGQAGWITTQGQVSGINLSAYNPGDILWLDSVPGGFTVTKPQAPKHSVFVGVVERANAGNGLIYVKPQNGVELSEIHDVRITNEANNDIIRYNSTLGYWENKNQSIFAYTAQTTTYTALASDYVIHCTSGTFTVNLPTAVGVQGKVYIVKNSGSGLITIDPNGTQTIDGALTYKIGGNESLKLMSTGANWITL
jgi:hypothetical protein